VQYCPDHIAKRVQQANEPVVRIDKLSNVRNSADLGLPRSQLFFDGYDGQRHLVSGISKFCDHMTVARISRVKYDAQMIRIEQDHRPVFQCGTRITTLIASPACMSFSPRSKSLISIWCVTIGERFSRPDNRKLST
jgi:hypothetical protein